MFTDCALMLKFFLLLALSFQRTPAPPNGGIDVYVVAVANAPSSVEDAVKITVEVLSQTQPYQEPQAVNGQRLPSECVLEINDTTGNQLCSAMLDVSDESLPDGPLFILAPLMNGVLIQKFVHENSDLLLVEAYPLLFQPGQTCSPVIMVRSYLVPTGIFSLCKSGEQLSLYKLVVDYSELSKSTAKYQGSNSVDTTQLSNFIEVTSTETSVAFISNDRLYQIDLQENFLSPIGDLPLESCVPVSQLVLVSNTLLAYCNDQSAVYFSTDGEFLNQTSPIMNGVPSVCPDPDVRLAIFNEGEYIKVGLWSENTYFQINFETRMYSSVCFGNKTALHFVYINASGSHTITINLLEPNLLEPTPVLPYTLYSNPCQLGSCEPLMVFYNRWLLLQVASTPHDVSVLVFDSLNGFDTVLERVHVNKFTLGTVLPFLQSSLHIPSSVIVSPTITSPTPTSSSPKKHSVTGIVLPSVLVVSLIGIFISISLIILCFRCQYRRRKSQQPYQEVSKATTETGSGQLLDEDSAGRDRPKVHDPSTTYDYDTAVTEVGDHNALNFKMFLPSTEDQFRQHDRTAMLSSEGSLFGKNV